MSGVATAIGVSALVSGGVAVMNNNAAKKAAAGQTSAANRAAELQAEAANRSTDLQSRMWEEQKDLAAQSYERQRQASGHYLEDANNTFDRERGEILRNLDGQLNAAEPWRKAGVSALSDLADSDFKRDFTMADYQKDPGYEFRMAEGQKALERSAAARGGLQSGGTLKALARYSQDYASNEYGNAYNRFNADRDRRFGRLSSIAGMGQNAAGQQIGAYGGATSALGGAYGHRAAAIGDAYGMMSGAGSRYGELMSAGGQQYVNGMSNTLMGTANSIGQNYIGAANASGAAGIAAANSTGQTLSSMANLATQGAWMNRYNTPKT